MIPLLDLQAQYVSIKEEINEAMQKVLDDQSLIMGETVRAFEREVGAYIGSEYAYGCASGSDALLLALMALDVGPGDAVITSPFTFFATAGAIARLGAAPVFLDIDPKSYNLNPEQVRQFMEGEHPLNSRLGITPGQVKAIIPVHLYGQMADMNPIMDLAKEYDLKVIEDSAQSIGSKYKGNNAGTMGDFGCFSFFPSKNLGAYGDGGLITVKDSELAEKVDVLRLHGAKPKYHHSLIGINSRLDALQAAILSVKLKYLDEWSDQRKQVADRYGKLFKEAGVVSDRGRGTEDRCCGVMGGEGCSLPEDKIVLPYESTGAGNRHIYHQYTIRSRKRDELIDYLNEKGIGNAVYYPIPLHVQECFADLGYQPNDCPAALCASKQVLSLPIYPELGEEQIREVVEAVQEFLNSQF